MTVFVLKVSLVVDLVLNCIRPLLKLRPYQMALLTVGGARSWLSSESEEARREGVRTAPQTNFYCAIRSMFAMGASRVHEARSLCIKARVSRKSTNHDSANRSPAGAETKNSYWLPQMQKATRKMQLRQNQRANDVLLPGTLAQAILWQIDVLRVGEYSRHKSGKNESNTHSPNPKYLLDKHRD